MILEIAVFNFQSAVSAQEAGADRLELCDNIFEGGTTTSYGILKKIKQHISIPVHPIIRPRGGDFLFTDDEFEIMKLDILLCKSLGYEGIVIGLLKNDASIDIDKTSILVELSYPMEVTFHRAFDRAKNPLQSLENIINCGCQRLLTSGQMPFANEGKHLIKQLITQADDRIIIMPGSGVRSNNIQEIIDATSATEIHSSASKKNNSLMQFNQTSMNEQLDMLSVNKDEIIAMKKNLASTN